MSMRKRAPKPVTPCRVKASRRICSAVRYSTPAVAQSFAQPYRGLDQPLLEVAYSINQQADHYLK